MKISTMNELLKKSICIAKDFTSYKRLSGLAKTLNLQNFKEDDRRFNTSNGILAFTSNGKMYVIPNFDSVIFLLKKEGFHQDYLMPVPDSSKLHGHRWENLLKDFHLQLSA